MNQYHSAWNHIDGVLVINMDKSPDRMEHFYRVNKGALPEDKVERVSAVSGRDLPGFGEPPWFMPRTGDRAGYWAGAAGCTLSHRKAVETAKSKGWKNVLILEDDAQVCDLPDALQLLDEVMPKLSGKFMLYFGYSRPTPYGKRLQSVGVHSLWKVEGVLSTYAYLVSEDLYDTLLEMLPTEETAWAWIARYRAIDSFYRDNVAVLSGVSTYVIQPDLIAHVDGMSEITGAATDTGHLDQSVEPYSYSSVAGICHLLVRPVSRLKRKLNTLRTYLRAKRRGLPGRRKRSK